MVTKIVQEQRMVDNQNSNGVDIIKRTLKHKAHEFTKVVKDW